MTLADITRLLLGAAAVLAACVAWRHRAHRPVAVFLGGQAIVQLACRLSWRPYLRAAVAAAGGDLDAGIRPPLPLDGWGRAVGIADLAAWLVWAPSFCALALWVFSDPIMRMTQEVGGRVRLVDEERSCGAVVRTAAPFGLWAMIVGSIALTYPEGREAYPRICTAAQLAAVLVAGAAMAEWLVRRYRDREGLTPTSLCVASIVVIEAGAMAGAHYWGLWAAWDLDRVMTCVMYVWLLLVMCGMMWRRRDG